MLTEAIQELEELALFFQVLFCAWWHKIQSSVPSDSILDAFVQRS